MTKGYHKFKDDGTTRRCQGDVEHTNVARFCADSYQCLNSAKHDNNTHCHFHSKAVVKKQKLKTAVNDVKRAERALKKAKKQLAKQRRK